MKFGTFIPAKYDCFYMKVGKFIPTKYNCFYMKFGSTFITGFYINSYDQETDTNQGRIEEFRGNIRCVCGGGGVRGVLLQNFWPPGAGVFQLKKKEFGRK